MSQKIKQPETREQRSARVLAEAIKNVQARKARLAIVNRRAADWSVWGRK